MKNAIYLIVRLGDNAMKTLNAKEIASRIASVIGGRAGGSKFFAQGGGITKMPINEIVNKALDVVRSCIATT